MSQQISISTMKAIIAGIVCVSLGGQTYADYTFTAGGKTGNIDAAGRVYDSNGVYSGNYNPSTGIYTNNNGGTINVNNTPGVTIYSNNVEVPKTPTPAPIVTPTPAGTSTAQTAKKTDAEQKTYMQSLGSAQAVMNYAQQQGLSITDLARIGGVSVQEMANLAQSQGVNTTQLSQIGYTAPTTTATVSQYAADGKANDDTSGREEYLRKQPLPDLTNRDFLRNPLSQVEIDTITAHMGQFGNRDITVAQLASFNPALKNAFNAAEMMGQTSETLVGTPSAVDALRKASGFRVVTDPQGRDRLVTGQLMGSDTYVDQIRMNDGSLPSWRTGDSKMGSSFFGKVTDAQLEQLKKWMPDVGKPVNTVTKNADNYMDVYNTARKLGIPEYQVTREMMQGLGYNPDKSTSSTNSISSVGASNAVSATNNTLVSSTDKTVSSTTVTSGNPYQPSLSPDIQKKLDTFLVKVVEKSNSFTTADKYATFLDGVVTKLSTAKNNPKYMNNTLIQNVVGYLLYEITGIRGNIVVDNNGTEVDNFFRSLGN